MKHNYLKTNLFLIVMIFFVNSILGQKSTSKKTASIPFNCDYYAYLFQYNDVYAINLASGSSQQVATDITPGNINAAGYNNADGYIWGSLSTPSKSIVRIGKNFSTETFYIDELPTSGRYIGDVDSNGIYFLKPGGTTVYKVDLDPASANYTEFINTITLDASISIHDWAFNATDGYLYTVEKKTNKLYRIDSATGIVTNLGEVPILAGLNYTYGAVYFDADGNFYVSANQTGTVYIIYGVQDLNAGGTMVSNLFAFGPSSSQNDGARCPTAIVPQENCTNGIDDDGDGLVDCDDPSCSGVSNCEVITPTTGGNAGGLESNNRLSQKITQRNFSRSKSNYKFNKQAAKRITKRKGARKSAVIQLNDFIPLGLFENTTAIESSPKDLLGITNATEILSVDYLKNSETVAAILAIKTNGGTYEHTKYICDRLLGAEILSVSTINLHEHTFIKTLIKHPNGDKEFVLSFSAKIVDNHFDIDSHWNLDRYDSEGNYYNFQIWSNNLDDLYKLGNEILSLIEVQRTIQTFNTSLPPSVYAKKGSYVNGKLELEIINTNNSETILVEGGVRRTETSNTEQVDFPMTISNQYTNLLKIETGSFFDFGFRIHAGSGDTPDDLFLSDGPWGIDDAASSTSVIDFNVTQNIDNLEDAEMIVERNIELNATTSEYVSAYKAFTPRFQPISLSAYKNFNLEALGTGKLTITFLKKSITDWDDQFKADITLTETSKKFSIPFTEFKNSLGAKFVPNDITIIMFTMTSEDGTMKNKKMEISNLYFKTEKSLSIFDEVMDDKKIIVSPNPVRGNAQINFSTADAEDCEILIHNIAGQVVLSKKVRTEAGKNAIRFHKNNLKSGMYFIKIKGSNTVYKTTKFLIYE